MTCSAIKDSMARFRANPWSAQTAPALTATLAEHGGRLTGGPFTWNVGLPPVVGAGNEGPSPTLYLLGALAGSAVALIHDTLAPQLGVRVAGVAATARCRSDLRSLLGMDGADPRLTGLAIEIAVDSSDWPQRVELLRRSWLQRCRSTWHCSTRFPSRHVDRTRPRAVAMRAQPNLAVSHRMARQASTRARSMGAKEVGDDE
jgi:hypothetical protein